MTPLQKDTLVSVAHKRRSNHVQTFNGSYLLNVFAEQLILHIIHCHISGKRSEKRKDRKPRSTASATANTDDENTKNLRENLEEEIK